MKILSKILFIFLLLQPIIGFTNDSYKFSLDVTLNQSKEKPLSNDPINFNFVKIGETRFKTFYIENTGTNTYTIEKIQFLNNGLGVFFFSATPKPPTVIYPNNSINILLTFSPNKVGNFYDTLLIFFNEPFYYVYALPVEGHSTSTNFVFIQDTSNFVGIPNFRVPIFVKGDPNLVEAVPVSLSLLITTNAKIYFIDSIENAKISSITRNQSYFSYKINLNNFILDSSQKTLCTLIGRLFLSSQDTAIITLSEIESDIKGINFEAKNGTVTTYGICVSSMSLVNFDFDYTEIKLLNEIVRDELKINFLPKGNKEITATIELFNLLGKEVCKLKVKASGEVIVPLSNLSSGLYRIQISAENQKYSKLISVIN